MVCLVNGRTWMLVLTTTEAARNLTSRKQSICRYNRDVQVSVPGQRTVFVCKVLTYQSPVSSEVGTCHIKIESRVKPRL